VQNSDGLKDPKSMSGNQEEQQNERIMKGELNVEFKNGSTEVLYALQKNRGI